MARSHFRPLATLLLTALLALSAVASPWSLVAAPQDFRWDPATKAYNVTNQTPINTVFVTSDFKIRNDDTTAGSYEISFPDRPSGWQISTTISQPITVNQATTSAAIPIRISIPPNTANSVRNITVRATRIDVASRPSADAVIELTLKVAAPGTPPNSACPEVKDPGGDLGGAALIRVDRAERHGICTVGDEDWYKFGAVAGKFYSIDIPEMDQGLDLSLELYDENGRLIDNNDDFPFRDGAESFGDTRPLIQSFRAPVNGYFYVRVRDTLGIGGDGLSYTVVVRGESYGQFPPFTASLCNDTYEQDGLPELARQINQNETQRGRALCPTGDADWVKFFALSGYTYYLYTNTRPYAPADANGVLAGADTVLFLFGRDAITLIDSNNNIEAGTTLDSLVRFIPSADGIYYAQIKNIGDVGGMFIKYDLTLKACPVEQPGCGPPADILPAPPPPPAPAAVDVLPLGQDVMPPPEAVAPQIGQAALPVAETSAAPALAEANDAPVAAEAAPEETIFALTGNQPIARQIDPSLLAVWQRVDMPVTTGRTQRSWIWGPSPRLARSEPYAQANSGSRQVLYFDKGRLEINDPNADRASVSFATAGLLVSEMVAGRVQIGNNEFVPYQPATIPVVGDLDDANAPTYASFSLAMAPVERNSAPVIRLLQRDGTLAEYTGPALAETRPAQYISETGHHIPRVFWDYLMQSGTVYDGSGYGNGAVMNWVAVVGLPLSEPYWVRVRVGGVERDVLVQLFERRALTYTPSEKPAWRVQTSNVGQHYYFWRYGKPLP